MQKSKIINGDSFIELKKIPDKSIDLILTDPPYRYLKGKNIEWDTKENDFNQIWIECERILKDNSALILFGRGISLYQDCLQISNTGLVFKEEIVWDKRFVSSPVTPISRRHELAIIFGKGKFKINTEYRIPYKERNFFELEKIEKDINRIRSALGNVSDIEKLKDFLIFRKKHFDKIYNHKFNITCSCSKKNAGQPLNTLQSIIEGFKMPSMYSCYSDIIECVVEHYNYKHPTQKPVRLLEHLINLCLTEKGTVCDPFTGSGSSGIAAIKNGHQFIGIEQDTEYSNIAEENINNASNSIEALLNIK